jgi:hypothetical protein
VHDTCEEEVTVTADAPFGRGSQYLLRTHQLSVELTRPSQRFAKTPISLKGETSLGLITIVRIWPLFLLFLEPKRRFIMIF